MGELRYSSMEYVEQEDLIGYESIIHTQAIRILKGYNTSAGAIEYHWEADAVEDLVEVLKANEPGLVTFVPKEWVHSLEPIGYQVRNAWHDYFRSSLEDVEKVPVGELLQLEEATKASEVTMACKEQSRGFTGETPEWMKHWILGDVEGAQQMGLKKTNILIHRKNKKEIVGILCVGTYGHDSEKGPILWIREVAVLPREQGQGIARSLLLRALSYGKELGATRGFLAADEQNKGAIHLYKSIGFEPSKEESQIDMVK